jgi:hypothetical protein
LTKISKDLVLILIIAILTYLVAIYLDLFEQFVTWSRRYEDWQLDELFIVLMSLVVAFIIFSLRRSTELQREIIHRQQVEELLQQTLNELQQKIEEGTAANLLLKQEIINHQQTEAQALQLLEENRQLIRRSMTIQEEERKRLARELHDEVGQCLTAIQADARTISELTPDRRERVSTSAEAIMSVSSHIYDVMHSMMRRLRPSGLDYLGLEDALKNSIQEWQARHPETRCTVEVTGDLNEVHEDISINIYRVVQECLTNIAKHAQATRVMIYLQIETETTPEYLTLRLQDDGKGMTPDRINCGLGLIGIRERAQALGGTFKIASELNQGVSIIFRVPIGKIQTISSDT